MLIRVDFRVSIFYIGILQINSFIIALVRRLKLLFTLKPKE